MDPTTGEPEEYGHDGDGHGADAGARRATRSTPDFGQHAPGARPHRAARRGRLPAHRQPRRRQRDRALPAGRAARPRPRSARAAERAELRRAARPPVPPGPSPPRLPLLEREEERERLVRLLARGRSVRLTGPAGSGRTALLDAVADGLRGPRPRRRRPAQRLPPHRRPTCCTTSSPPSTTRRCTGPDRAELLALVREIGAVVVLDDLEFGGAALDELLDATPECAFLIAATPDVPAPVRRLAPRRGLPRRPRPRPAARTAGARRRPRPHRGRGELGGRPLVRVRGPAAALRPGRRAAAAARPAARRRRRLRRVRRTSRTRPSTRPSTPRDGHDVPLPVARRGRRARRAARLPAQRVGARHPALRRRARRRGAAPGASARPGGRHPRGRRARRAARLRAASPRSARHYRLAAGVHDPAGGRRVRATTPRPTRPHRRPALRLVGRAPLGHPRAGRAPRRTPCSPR